MKFQITYNETGKVTKFRANDWMSFESEVLYISRWLNTFNNPETDYIFSVDGQTVSLDLAQKSAMLARDAWEEKRAVTKKPIRISQGATLLPNTYRTIWVKK